MRNNRNNINNVRVRASTLTIGELKAANSIYLDNYFKWRYINKRTADIVRWHLVVMCPQIYRW